MTWVEEDWVDEDATSIWVHSGAQTGQALFHPLAVLGFVIDADAAGTGHQHFPPGPGQTNAPKEQVGPAGGRRHAASRCSVRPSTAARPPPQ